MNVDMLRFAANKVIETVANQVKEPEDRDKDEEMKAGEEAAQPPDSKQLVTSC